jgi:hypothetical protein
MSFDVSVGKYRPLRWVFPTIIPGGLRELRASTVNSLDCGYVTDTVLVWSKAHNGTVLLMKSDILMLKASMAYSVEVPKGCESSPEWTWNIL